MPGGRGRETRMARGGRWAQERLKVKGGWFFGHILVYGNFYCLISVTPAGSL